MKLKYLFAALAILAMVCTCASAKKSNVADDLDAAIQQASKEINDILPVGTKIALLNFTSGSDVLSDYVLEEMSIALVKGRKLTVVDRKEIDLIRGELNFQMSGEVSDESAQEIGKLLGAQSIISGSLVTLGEFHRFRTKVINVNSAAIETSSSIIVENNSLIQALLSQSKSPVPQTAQSGTGTRAVPAQADTSNQAQPATPAPAPAEPALPAYKIGDTGPAGGLIFYDKGNNSSGWRYLEAGPVDIEFRGVWSVRHTVVANIQPTIGSGKRNTQLAVEIYKQTTGEWDTAPQKVVELEFNGFNDWFIPSRDELDQMYGNLKLRNLGDFKNDSYMASSADGNMIHFQNFSNGSINAARMGQLYVRPIRQVPGPNTARSSVDDNGGIAGTTTGTTGTTETAGITTGTTGTARTTETVGTTATTKKPSAGMRVLNAITGFFVLLLVGGGIAYLLFIVISGPPTAEATP